MDPADFTRIVESLAAAVGLRWGHLHLLFQNGRFVSYRVEVTGRPGDLADDFTLNELAQAALTHEVREE